MKTYQLYVDGQKDMAHFDISEIKKRQKKLLSAYAVAQEYGEGFYFGKEKPKFRVFEIEENIKARINLK